MEGQTGEGWAMQIAKAGEQGEGGGPEPLHSPSPARKVHTLAGKGGNSDKGQRN